MKKYERISIIFSIIALTVSLTMPIVGYFRFNSFEQKFRYQPEVFFRTADGFDSKGYFFEIYLRNEGKTPAQDITVTLKPFADYIVWPEEISVESYPVSPINTIPNNGNISMKVERALGYKEELKIKTTGIITPEFGGQGLLICNIYWENGTAQFESHTAYPLKSDFGK